MELLIKPRVEPVPGIGVVLAASFVQSRTPAMDSASHWRCGAGGS